MSNNILEDEKLLSFRKAFDNGEYSLNTDSFMEEVRNIHITRGIRTMNSEDVLKNIHKVIDAVLQNQSCRSRVVEIKMMCVTVLTKLNFRKEALINYIQVRYQDQLKQSYRTINDRKAYLEELLSFTNTNTTKLQVLQNFCDLLIQDIDNASWALKSVIDCLKISDVANNSIV